MKKFITFMLLLTLAHFSSQAQSTYGKTLNVGVGIGYYGYLNHSLPVLHFNYELDAAKNFTLAPFISIYSYRHGYNRKRGYYDYRETVVPIGVKGTYYFDSILKANPKWDFYLAGSLGFAIRSVRWHDDYPGDHYYRASSPLYLDLHLGTEYHLNSNIGLFLDLSTGVSTFGLSFH
ncbi:MAG: hypothetical protein ACO1O1_08400 [Adhaeribacter sp.]